MDETDEREIESEWEPEVEDGGGCAEVWEALVEARAEQTDEDTES